MIININCGNNIWSGRIIFNLKYQWSFTSSNVFENNNTNTKINEQYIKLRRLWKRDETVDRFPALKSIQPLTSRSIKLMLQQYLRERIIQAWKHAYPNSIASTDASSASLLAPALWIPVNRVRLFDRIWPDLLDPTRVDPTWPSTDLIRLGWLSPALYCFNDGGNEAMFVCLPTIDRSVEYCYWMT